jgi:hypothetical protein
MLPIRIGADQESGDPIILPPDLFRTHFHLLGATGSGKTNAIHVMLRPILATPRPKCALFLIDPIGNLSDDLLKWIADERLCPDHVRQRLVYIEPARDDAVLPFNPLLFDTEDHLYFQVGRAVEIILRAWASQHVDEMPRLRHWTFASFFAAAAVGLPIAACRYLLRPGTEEHDAILARLPDELRCMWSDILRARSNESMRLLESTRNRLAPFFDCGILRRMFSCVESRFDVARFIRERRIVILNVGSKGKLDLHIAKTIGGLAVNEIIRTAMNLRPAEVDPTYLLLDEFQHFVSEDLYQALPTVRQLGLRLILAHQSFDQLERGDIDLSGLIWQARSRLMFANDADDADRIAHELATLSYDPMKLKDILYTQRQRMAGHRREWVNSLSQGRSTLRGQDSHEGKGMSRTFDESPYGPHTGQPINRTESDSHGISSKYAETVTENAGQSETMIPIHEDFLEVSRKTFFAFDEQRTLWAQKIRQRRTGEAFGKFRDDKRLYDILIDYDPIVETPRLREKVAELIERNFQSELFLSKPDVEKSFQNLRESLLHPSTITVRSSPVQSQEVRPQQSMPTCREAASSDESPFA